MRRVDPPSLEGFLGGVLAAAGADEPSRAAVTRALMEASLRGTDSHGIQLFPLYVRGLERGTVSGRPSMRYQQRLPAVGVLDADNGFGHLAGYRAIEHGIAAARTVGMAAVAVGNSTHYGAAACYSLAAARAGFAAMSVTHAPPLVLPHEGRTPFNGTNPIAFAAPVEGEEPLSVDIATSTLAWNRLHILERSDGTLPAEAAVDADGNDARTLAEARALLPLGGRSFGHKGAALASMVDVLCSAFADMAHGFRILRNPGPDRTLPRDIGHFFLVLDPDAFLPAEGYARRMKAYLDDLRAQPAMPDRRVDAPGDPEAREAQRRRRGGIPVAAQTWTEFADLARRYGIILPREAVVANRSAAPAQGGGVDRGVP
jgi:LDH2 family malate/lactate/ureidoglycolate dehydrogenase